MHHGFLPFYLPLYHAELTQHHIQVSGMGKYPFLALERADLQFGNVLVGEQVEQTVQLANQGLLAADFNVTQVQPPPGSFADSSVKITPTRSDWDWRFLSVRCCWRCHKHTWHLVLADHHALMP